MRASPAQVAEIDVRELARLLAGDAPPVVLDVREATELAICAIEGALHIPMQEVPARLEELPRERPLVVLCHHGVRSRMVAEFLRRAGRADVANLSGGIDAWAREIDTDMALY